MIFDAYFFTAFLCLWAAGLLYVIGRLEKTWIIMSPLLIAGIAFIIYFSRDFRHLAILILGIFTILGDAHINDPDKGGNYD